jgi:hypothetical protein
MYRAKLAKVHGGRNPDLQTAYDAKLASMPKVLEEAKDAEKVRGGEQKARPD